MRRLVTVRGDVDISSVATDVGWSRRHLSEQFGAEYGVTPKEMARVLRFERSKMLFVGGVRATLAEIAAECGYADQAHMAREWRTLAGASPTQWLADEQLPVAHATDVLAAVRAERVLERANERRGRPPREPAHVAGVELLVDVGARSRAGWW